MIIERTKLIEFISKVLPGIDSKELVESMSQLHFTGKKIVTYNDQIYCSIPFPTDFICSVHSRTLFNLLKGLTTEKVKIELEGTRLKFNTAGVAANLNIGDGTEINEILNVIDKEIKTLKVIEPLPTDFLKGVELCAFSAFTKDIGGSFTCIKTLEHRIMSSDRNRFSLFETDSVMADMMFKATVAADMVKYNLKLYSYTKAWIHFFEAKDGLVFSVRRYTGEYPAEEIATIAAPKNIVAKIVLPEEMLSALGFLNIFTEGQEQKHAKLDLGDGMLTIQVSGVKGSITKKMKVESKQSFSFTMNPTLLGEILKRGMRTMELDRNPNKPPMVYFRSKGFVHAIALFGGGE